MNPQNDEETVTQTEQTESKTEQEVEEPPAININDIPVSTLNEIENTEEKKKLIFTIQKYQDSLRFGKTVKFELGFKKSFTELSEMSEVDLENMLYRIRRHLDNKNLDKFYENMASTIAITYEQSLSMIYPIHGFSDMLLESEDFWNCYERYRIESEFPSVNPLTQMCFMIAQYTLIAHHTPSSDDEYVMEDPLPVQQILASIEEEPTKQTKQTEPVEIKPTEKTKQTEPVEIKPVSLGQFI